MAKYTMDTAIRNITNDLAADIYGNGSGARGQIASINTGAIQLLDPNSVTQFELNMTLDSFSVSGSTATQSTAAAIGYIVGVDRTNGIITVSATPGGAAGTPTNWSTSFPNLGVSGDTNFSSGGLAQGLTLKVCGLGAWIPTTAPASNDSFWGVNRFQDVTRLGGVRFDGRNESIEEAIIDAASLLAREGGRPTMAFMPYSSWAALEKAIGGKVVYVDVEHSEAKIMYSGIKIMGPKGPIVVIADRSAPSATCYLLQMNTWKLRSLGKCPQILTYGLEGLEGLRVGNADALEIRWGLTDVIAA